ncbi:forkhead box protein I1-A-like [Anneissia japonica]|uniref:forkhead box protein I1-A-like n=1 Tax=Anneissia japonica TaxID=1529436 RepID=UPI0014259316|nr:forkhead box protein I1-A-like [Anneissia japonica]
MSSTAEKSKTDDAMGDNKYLNLPLNLQSSKENVAIQLGVGESLPKQNSDSHGRPMESYAQMIAKAIKSSSSYSASLPEIYEFITSKYPFYCENRMHWKNSVRHNLTVQKELFKRLPGYELDARGCSRWTLADGFEELLQKRQKRRNSSLRTAGQKYSVRPKFKKIVQIEKNTISPRALNPGPQIQISPPESPASVTSVSAPEDNVVFNDPSFANLTSAESVSLTDSDSSVLYQDHYIYTKSNFESSDRSETALWETAISGEVLPGELSPYKEDFYPSPPEAVPVSIWKNESVPLQVGELTPLSTLDVFQVLHSNEVGLSPLYEQQLGRPAISNFRYYVDGENQQNGMRSQLAIYGNARSLIVPKTPIDQVLVVDTNCPPLCTV